VNAGPLEVPLSPENACSIAHHLGEAAIRSLTREPVGTRLNAREVDLPRALLAMADRETLVACGPADEPSTTRFITVQRAGPGWLVLAPENELRRLAARIKEQA